MATRRRFLKLVTASGVAVYFTPKLGLWSVMEAQVPGGTLSPGAVAKFVTPLVIPPAMPVAASDATTDYYSIGVRQISQQILPLQHRSDLRRTRSRPGPRGARRLRGSTSSWTVRDVIYRISSLSIRRCTGRILAVDWPVAT